MQKKMIALLAGALMMISASSAFAAFDDLNLIRVVYGTTNEVATDLGVTLSASASPLAMSNVTLSTGASNFVAMNVGATGAGSSDYVAYYASDAGNSGAMWFSANQVGAIGSTIAVNANNATAATGQLSVAGAGVSSWYQSLTPKTTEGTITSVSGAKSNVNSYAYSFDIGASQSGLSTLNSSLGVFSDMSLAAAANQGLYYWDGSSATATEIATLTTNLDGSTTINQASATTPIPPSILLMGSGLLGMVGLRRKKQ